MGLELKGMKLTGVQMMQRIERWRESRGPMLAASVVTWPKDKKMSREEPKQK